MQQIKSKINSVGWQHTRVDNNKTNKIQASRFRTSQPPFVPPHLPAKDKEEGYNNEGKEHKHWE